MRHGTIFKPDRRVQAFCIALVFACLLIPVGTSTRTGLLCIGLLHRYLIWWGDILISYALIGFLALAFRNASVRALVITAVVLIAIQLLIFGAMTGYALTLQEAIAAGSATAEQLMSWEELTRDTIMPTAARRAEAIARAREEGLSVRARDERPG